MTGPLAPPARAASSVARASFPFCSDRPWHSRQCRARMGAISASKTLAADRVARPDRARLGGGRLRDRSVALPDLDPGKVRRAAARRQPDRSRIDDDPPRPQPLPRPGRAADVVMHDLPAVQGDAERLGLLSSQT